ncbi:PIG-L family deacetylase [Myxococcota bacterium]|nr:PIG-L family deacetylase [Myxococcota bacterium]MBU1537288.1 PIG-L family deacetylase [Myxococcota bacterium]
MSRNILIISPHLDDAALSLSQHILYWLAKGDTVTIATLFTRGSVEQQTLYTARKAEDLEAAAKLGATSIYLNFLDAPFRFLEPISYTNILSWPTQPSIEEAVMKELTTILHSHQFDTILAPLGVGNHVDHRVAFNAAHALSYKQTLYYEERPYAIVPEHIQMRTGEPVSFDASFWERYWSTGYISSFSEQKDHKNIMELYEKEGTRAEQPKLVRHSSMHNHKLAQQSLAVVSLYKTQTPALYPHPQEFQDLYLNTPETLWILQAHDNPLMQNNCRVEKI